MELEILRHIQSIANPFFDFLFQLITMCGEQIVLISIISIIYWALDKKFGEYIAYSVLTSVLLNNAVKDRNSDEIYRKSKILVFHILQDAIMCKNPAFQEEKE